MLLVGAGLVGRSLWKLMNVDVGIDPSNLLTFETALPSSVYPDDASTITFYDRLQERLLALPGVQSVGAINIAPLTGSFDGSTVRTPEKPEPLPDERVQPQVRTITPGYFGAAGIELVSGRFLDQRDRADAPRATVITRSLARMLWPGEDAIGRQVLFSGDPLEVVGIVKDVKHLDLTEELTPMLFVDIEQTPFTYHRRRLTTILRTTGDPTALAAGVRREVAALDPLLPVSRLRTMEQIVTASAGAPRFRAVLLGSFAALALLLATVGIYGVVAYSVTQRSRELAIRAALGARTNTLLRMVVSDGLAPVLLGLGVGLAGAFMLSRILAAVLFRITPTDASVFAGVPALLLVVALIAALVPARRATRADPMNVLRES
jgi:putative ABC transport system permease protein